MMKVQRCTFKVLSVFTVISLLSFRSYGQLSEFLIGHNEPMMGRNGVGYLGSPAGLYFNPSLLGTLERNSLSAAGSAFYLVQAQGEANGASAKVSSLKAT